MKEKILFLAVLLTALLQLSCSKNEDGEKTPEETATYSGTALKDMTLNSVYLNGEMGTYTIYLPADYKTSGRKYPVLYLLHGMGGDHNDWSNYGSLNLSTRNAINDGQVGQLIIVMPKAYSSFYVDDFDKEHQYESFFLKELMPHIESTYPVLTGKKNTAIAGLSMGGYGASYYAFNYPEKFCLCYSMSGAVEGLGIDQVPSVQEIFEDHGYSSSNFSSLPKYYMDCGKSDPLVHSANVNTYTYLTSINFPVTYRETDGAHDWVFWAAAYKRLLPDLGQFFTD